MVVELDIDKSVYKMISMQENRALLYDDNINIMGLS